MKRAGDRHALMTHVEVESSLRKPLSSQAPPHRLLCPQARPPFTPVTKSCRTAGRVERIPRNARSTIVNQAVAGGPSDLSGAKVLRDASNLARPTLSILKVVK